MRPRLAFAAVVILVALGVSLTIHRPTFSRPQTKPCGTSPCAAQIGDPVPHELNFAYYSLRDGFNSTLFLVSDSPNPIDFVLTIYSLSGKPVVAPVMTIPAGEKLAVDLAKLLTDLGADVTGDFAEGSLSLQYTAAGMRPLVGQVTITNPREHLVYESFRMGKDAGRSDIPPVLNALWWDLGGGREATIAISNTANQETVADVFLDFQGARHKSEPLEFGPHETKVLSISELLSDLDVSPAQVPEGGITIIDRAQNPALIGQGRIIDPKTGFSTTLNFLLTPDQRGPVFHASGMPIGTPADDSPYAGMGTFIPHAIVRNLSASAQSVTVIIDYPGQEGPRHFTLPPMSLTGYTTQDISLDQAMTDLPLPLPYCSIRIQYSGAPGSTIAEVSSVEQREDLVVDSRLGNEGDRGRSSGNYPWHLDDETESIFFLTNMGDNDNPIAFQIQAAGVRYSGELKLGPRETRAINIRKLRDAQKPDFQGHKLPADVSEGVVRWVKIRNSAPVMARVVVINARQGMASNYNCTGCVSCPPSFTSVDVSPPSVTAIPGDTQQFTCTEHRTDCNGTDFPTNVTIGAVWTSWDTTVATVNSSGLGTAVGGGSTNIVAQFTDDTYPYVDSCVPVQRTLGNSAKCDVVSANITVHFTGSKSPGDNLTFPSGQTCSQNLGLLNCPSPGDWVWNVEIQADVSDDASNWTPHQSYTGSASGYYRGSGGTLQSFSYTLNVPNDDPSSSFVQKPSGQKTVFWIDAPGHKYTDGVNPIDSITQIQNFTSTVCSTRITYCKSVNWYLKLVVKPGAVLDTTNSTTGFGSLP